MLCHICKLFVQNNQRHSATLPFWALRARPLSRCGARAPGENRRFQRAGRCAPPSASGVGLAFTCKTHSLPSLHALEHAHAACFPTPAGAVCSRLRRLRLPRLPAACCSFCRDDDPARLQQQQAPQQAPLRRSRARPRRPLAAGAAMRSTASMCEPRTRPPSLSKRRTRCGGQAA